jgi:hypothetical protein
MVGGGGGCIQELKDNAVFIHHGPTKQHISRVSGGVDIVLSEEVVRDWRGGGGKSAHPECDNKATRFILRHLKEIKSNSKCYNTLCLSSSAYLPDSGNKDPNAIQDFNDEITDQVKKLENNSYVIIGVDINIATGVIPAKVDKRNINTRRSIGRPSCIRGAGQSP